MNGDNITATEELINEVLTTQDIDRLYQLNIECSQDIAVLKTRKSKAETVSDQIDIDNDLMIYHSILSTIKERIPHLRFTLQKQHEEELSMGHKFKIAAKFMLTHATYEKIMHECFHSKVSELREKSDQLTKNKLE